MLGWHCCGVISCMVHQSKYLSLCLVAWYLLGFRFKVAFYQKILIPTEQ